MKWFIVIGYPYPQKVAECSSLKEAINLFSTDKKLYHNEWNSSIVSELFGKRKDGTGGGSHRAIWKNGNWVNPRTGNLALEEFA